MKLFTPQISWHNRLPVLCLDIVSIDETKCQYKLATGGNDCKVYIWNLKETNIQIIAGLRRHQRSVGACRFSSNAQQLASGDDDGYIYCWKLTTDQPSSNFGNDDDVEDLESWKQSRVLRGHVEDICDLTWSKDGSLLLSGSVDNSAILWDPEKGTKVWCSDMIRGYVQGVAFDPLGEYMIALSSDRTLRIFNVEERSKTNIGRKMRIQNSTLRAFFCDDTLQTFCRRPDFSPCGKFLLVPAGQISEDGSKPRNVCFLFKRNKLNKPYLFYPTKESALCVRFCPVIFELRKNDENFWDLPYRVVFAVATSRSVLIYDSQQSTPIGYATNIHMARLTDLAWSPDARLLTASSYDGYCTMFSFKKDEFGHVYTKDVFIEEPKPEIVEIPPPEPPKKPEPPQPIKNDIRKYLICKKVPSNEQKEQPQGKGDEEVIIIESEN